MDELRGSELRIIRAYENLVALKDEIYKLRNSWPGFVLVENEPDPGLGIKQAFPLQDYLSIYLGDFLQGLRAALDYAAWQCRTADDTYFPICLTETGPPGSFEWWVDKNGSRQEGRGRKMVKDMTPAQGDMIRSLQPYRGGGQNHPLWMLHEYARRERHRLLLLTSGIVWAAKVDVPVAGTEYERRGELPRIEVAGGLLRLSRPVGDPNGQVEPKTPITVNLPHIDSAPNGNLFAGCDRILAYMNEAVIPAFRQVFPAK
jgi:hypothetical protein